MDVRILLLISVILTFAMVKGGFFYNALPPTSQQIEERGLKCIPGRTVIRIGQEKDLKQKKDSSEEETRRSHMNAMASDESCKICVCSVEGKDEYCKARPARNVNECIRMAILKRNIEKNLPFSHERALSFRIRRDYIWHYDEIPYDPKAACRRGTSYYTNNINAFDTDIDVPSDVDSLLDYSNKDICFYCVCSVNGVHSGCINRDSWFCNYHRIIREPDAPKQKYRQLFQQDRPAYFRQLSYRMRRMMDDGIVAFMDVVGEDSNSTKCIPYVSEYSDCTDANECSGCTRCSCTESGEWNCQMVFECPTDDDDTNPETINVALDMMFSELKNKQNKKKPRILVPPPPRPEDELIVSENNPYEESFESFFARQKRSVNFNSLDNKSKNHTIKFYHTVDELNKDTLKDFNDTGTIEAKKMDTNSVSKISRRTGLLNNLNKSSLHIAFNQPEEYDHHIIENKIETLGTTEKFDELLQNKLEKFIGNFSQATKDADISKLVVNELKVDSELIGDKNVSPMSNITFTPENDTLTAMAFIAGNLLNKLWNMEQDSSDGLIETEVLKHEKINDLLELFKEPLNLRQETFLKNALEKLSNTLNKNKDIKNVSLCETIAAPDTDSNENLDTYYEKNTSNKSICNQKESRKNDGENKQQITTDVVYKLNNVLNLIKKYERSQKNLNNLKFHHNKQQPGSNVSLTIDETSSLHIFGSLLEKITKLLIPGNANKKIINRIKNLSQLSNDKDNIKKFVESKFDIDFGTLPLKDKLILDYINHIENNPHCLLRKNVQDEPQSNINIDGNIFNNLSELVRVKSFVDLFNLMKSKKINKTQAIELSTEKPIAKSYLENKELLKLNTTKEKLKSHLKAIIDDLLELQNDSSYFKQNKINIADALPCIYNIMNSEKILNSSSLEKSTVSPIDKIKTLIDSLKVEFTSNLSMRRNNLPHNERSQSAKLWERVIKNISNLQMTRRSSKYEKPKSYQELKDVFDKVESTGNTYKNFALLSVVPPHKRLMLLKTLEADTKQQEFALENLKKSLSNLIKLPLEKKSEIKEFVDNAERSLNLSINVVKKLTKSKQKVNSKFVLDIFNNNNNKEIRQPDYHKKLTISNNNNFKLTRDQLIIHLIENRIKLYLASKEVNDADLKYDMNYNVGKRILSLIENGNIKVAKELFIVFIANLREQDTKIDGKVITSLQSVKLKESLFPLESLVNEPKSKETQLSPDHLFKQLLNIKNMNF